MKLKKAKYLKTIEIKKTKIFDFKKDEVIWINGKKLTKHLISHRGIASIVPVLDQRYIILLKQYRYGANKIMLEVPAGTIDEGETPFTCAKRELIEETGYKGSNWKNIGKYYPTPAYNSSIAYCYSTECFEKGATNLDPDEVIESAVYSFNEIRKLINENKLSDMKSYISLDRFFRNY